MLIFVLTGTRFYGLIKMEENVNRLIALIIPVLISPWPYKDIDF